MCKQDGDSGRNDQKKDARHSTPIYSARKCFCH